MWDKTYTQRPNYDIMLSGYHYLRSLNRPHVDYLNQNEVKSTANVNKPVSLADWSVVFSPAITTHELYFPSVATISSSCSEDKTLLSFSNVHI